MNETNFYHWYRGTLLTSVGVWRITLCLLGGISRNTLVRDSALLLWMTLPYAILAWAAVLMKTRVLLLATTALCIGIDVLNTLSILHPTRSTAGVGLVLAPLWQILIIIPGGIVLDWTVRWAYRGFPIGPRSNRNRIECDDEDVDED